SFLDKDFQVAVANTDANEIRWFTFAGTVLNRALADAISSYGYEDVRIDDFLIRISGTTNYPKLFDTIEAQTPATICNSFKIPSVYLGELKFSECLPRAIAEEMMKDRLLSTARLSSVLRTKTKMVSL